MQTGLEKWKGVRRVACNREDRFRRNTIAFWLSDEEKNQVEAKIILSGISKGEYYRKAVLGQEVTVIAGNYMSVRVAKVLEQVVHEVEIECFPRHLPESIVADISSLGLNVAFRVKDLVVADVIKLLDDPDMAIASVKMVKEDVPATEETATADATTDASTPTA